MWLGCLICTVSPIGAAFTTTVRLYRICYQRRWDSEMLTQVACSVDCLSGPLIRSRSWASLCSIHALYG